MYKPIKITISTWYGFNCNLKALGTSQRCQILHVWKIYHNLASEITQIKVYTIEWWRMIWEWIIEWWINGDLMGYSGDILYKYIFI